MTMASVTPAEARRLIEDGAKLVDVRDRDEYAREHIPGAANIPVAEIDRLDAGDCPVVFHCRSGARSGVPSPYEAQTRLSERCQSKPNTTSEKYRRDPQCEGYSASQTCTH